MILRLLSIQLYYPRRAAINTCAAADHGCKRLFVLLLGIVVLFNGQRRGWGSPWRPWHENTKVTWHRISWNCYEALENDAAVHSSFFSGFCKATLSALLIFAGYESAAAVGEETKDAPRTVPKAIVFTVIICGLFYWWASVTLALGYDTGKDWASDSSTLVTLGTRFVGHWGGTLLFVMVLFDGWAGSLACVNLVSRL